MVTIKEIAREANVSPTTVSLILNRKSKERKISPQTEKRVLEIARRMGYLPNLQAVGLKKSGNLFAHRILIFWIADSRTQTMIRFFRGIEENIESNNLPFEVLLQSYRAGQLKHAMKNELLLSCHGIIVCNASESDMEFLDGSSFPRPLILYNRYSDKYSGVVMDDRTIGAIPAEVFASHGRKHPALVTGPPTFNGMHIRQNLFAYTCQSLGMAEALVCRSGDSPKSSYETTVKLLCEHPETDCIFYLREELALGALRAFSEKGIRFPDDMELIAIGDANLGISEVSSPTLSVLRLQLEHAASEIINLLNSQIYSPGCTVTSTVLPVTYVPRVSCPAATPQAASSA
ncbi:MAG: LacI family transcriptional regulator [Lachnospiraceae bacterium]|nr:LacI family transcriptional regulator [Lachnospiraceae bacterium]